MNLTYWICDCLDDHKCYSIRTRTKREAVARREGGEYGSADRFDAPRKITITYADAFDLVTQALGEGGAE